MSTPRLQGVSPQWDHVDHNGDELDEPREVLEGSLRIVHRQRARKLRRRGEKHLIDFRRSFPDQGYKAVYGWVVEPFGSTGRPLLHPAERADRAVRG